jgi:hypothetical protein
MRAWYSPSWHGDFRLVAAADDPAASQLVILEPTAHERGLLTAFLAVAHKRKWTTATLPEGPITTHVIMLKAPVAKAGPALVRATKPAKRTLTAVTFKDGRVETAETAQLEALAEKAAADPAAAAASVARPTPCCPQCEPGSIAPARDVLLTFLTPTQHADWAAHRAITVIGGQSGHRYLLAHRHTPTAVRLGKVCYDLDDGFVVHFHASDVPPEEEILAAKLILEHREPWLRNEATVLQQDADGGWRDLGFMRYKNPFGDANDGRWDASLSVGIGAGALAWAATR